MFADTSKQDRAKIKLNVEMNALMNHVKLNHVMKAANNRHNKTCRYGTNCKRIKNCKSLEKFKSLKTEISYFKITVKEQNKSLNSN